MKMINNINELAEIFYDRFMDDMELNGTYDESDPTTKLSEEIDSILLSFFDVKTVNVLEEKIFTLADISNKEYYITGFMDGVNVIRSILLEEEQE